MHHRSSPTSRGESRRRHAPPPLVGSSTRSSDSMRRSPRAKAGTLSSIMESGLGSKEPIAGLPGGPDEEPVEQPPQSASIFGSPESCVRRTARKTPAVHHAREPLRFQSRRTPSAFTSWTGELTAPLCTPEPPPRRFTSTRLPPDNRVRTNNRPDHRAPRLPIGRDRAFALP